MHGGLCCTSGLSASAALLYPSKRDANGGVGGGDTGVTAARSRESDAERVSLRERECGWVCGHLCVWGVSMATCQGCVWSREIERGREKDETRRKLSLVKGWGGEWDKLMGKVGLPPPLCLPLPPYQPSTVYFLQPWQASFSLSLSHISNSVPLQGNFKACRVCVLCHMGGFLGNNQVHKTHLRKSPRHHRFLLT